MQSCLHLASGETAGVPRQTQTRHSSIFSSAACVRRSERRNGITSLSLSLLHPLLSSHWCWKMSSSPDASPAPYARSYLSLSLSPFIHPSLLSSFSFKRGSFRFQSTTATKFIILRPPFVLVAFLVIISCNLFAWHTSEKRREWNTRLITREGGGGESVSVCMLKGCNLVQLTASVLTAIVSHSQPQLLSLREDFSFLVICSCLQRREPSINISPVFSALSRLWG